MVKIFEGSMKGDRLKVGIAVSRFNNFITDEMNRAIEFLDHYLLGERGMFPKLYLKCFTDKERAVYNELIKIPFGSTISYNELAENAGIKNGARFVGNAMAKNLFPIFIPCHRVIKANRGLGNYSAGMETKRFLLQHEKVLLNKSTIDG